MSKRALGKGLDALIQSVPQVQTAEDEIVMLELEKIEPNIDQPRKQFIDETLEELALSIREKGVIQPIIVENKDGKYIIVAGERRYRAAKIAGLSSIPTLVRQYSPEELLQISLIENIQREDLNPIDEAMAYEKILKEAGLSQDDLSKKIGKSRSTIANTVRLLKLPEEMRKGLLDDRLTAGHARAILSVVNPADQKVLFDKILADSYSVREAEAFAEKLNRGSRGTKELAQKAEVNKPPEIQDVEQKFIEYLGTKVQIKGSLSKGKIEISYFSEEDLARLYELLAGG